MKRIVAIVLIVLSGCTVSPVPTPPVTPAASATAFATVAPTDAPPDRLLHPSRMSPVLGKADVMEIVCDSVTTTIAGYSWGLEWHYDDAAKADCKARGVLP